MDAAEPGGLGGTFAGNPLACAAALATLDAFEDEDLLERAREIGRRSGAARTAGGAPRAGRRSAWARRDGRSSFTTCRRPHGRGMPKQIVDEACRLGLILMTAGPNGNSYASTCRLSPATTISASAWTASTRVHDGSFPIRNDVFKIPDTTTARPASRTRSAPLEMIESPTLTTEKATGWSARRSTVSASTSIPGFSNTANPSPAAD